MNGFLSRKKCYSLNFSFRKNRKSREEFKGKSRRINNLPDTFFMYVHPFHFSWCYRAERSPTSYI